MKIQLVSLAVVAALATVSQAALVVNETFSYADGNLVGNDPAVGGAWNAHSGAASTPVQVTSGAAVLVQGGGSREDVNVPFEGGVTAGAGAKLTATFDLTVPAITAVAQETMFAHFLAGTTNFTSRLYIAAPTTSGFRLAMSNDNSAIDGDGEVYSGDLAFGTTYRIVTTYDYDTTFGSFSINGGTPLLATDPGFTNAVSAFALRQAAGNTTQLIDNLTVDYVVPEPATLGLLAGMGVIGLRRRSAR